MMLTPMILLMRKASVAAACILALALPLGSNALALEPDPLLKIAPDLLATISAPVLPVLPWATRVNGEVLVKVLVTAGDSDDELLTGLRSFVLSLGGSIFYNYASVRMLAAMVPA